MAIWGWVLLLLLSPLLWQAVLRAARFCRVVIALRRFPRSLGVHWFWGTLFLIQPDEATILRVRAWRRETGHRLVSAWLGPTIPAIALLHCETVAKVLKEQKHLDTYHLLLPWLGEGLLVAEGKKWRRNRRLLTPAFHLDILRPYVTTYNACLQGLFQKWSTAATSGRPVLLFDSISLLSLDIVLQCAFSFRSDCQGTATRHPYITAVYQLVECVADRFFTPLYQFNWIYYRTPSGRRMRGACKVVHEHAERVIHERRMALQLRGGGHGNGRGRRDFLDVLLLARDEEGEGLTDLEIRNEVDTFMFEGHDTTTSGMCWTLYLLAKHPEHQERVREEVREVLAGREWLEYEDLKQLKYTHWCIKEAMRLYPPVLVIFRQTTKDIELEGHVVPPGVMLLIGVLEMHNNSEIWPNPERFDPLRFHPSNCEDRNPFAYIPFSAGHRNCIGQNFATNEEKVVVASIVHRFRLSLVMDHIVEMVPKVILRTKNDIKINLTPI